jgi:hypothetical protein
MNADKHGLKTCLIANPVARDFEADNALKQGDIDLLMVEKTFVLICVHLCSSVDIKAVRVFHNPKKRPPCGGLYIS